MHPAIKDLLPTIPDEPGCYLFFNMEGKVVYVGKAKKLKRRVSSYFNKEHRDAKTRRLVSSIYDLKYFVVETEEEALILENSLIKTHQPRYNILLKDGSSYPYIVVTKEEFPRILITRDVDTSIHIVYGPFTDVIIARKILSFLRQSLFIRTCRLPLTTDKIAAGKFRYCLQYHIKRCKAPCVGNVSASDYQDNIATAKAILSGDANALVLEEEAKMLSASEALNYEEAAIHKERIDLLRRFRTRSVVSNAAYGDLAVFAYIEDSVSAVVCMMHVRDGDIVRVVTDSWGKSLEEASEDLFASIVSDLLLRYPLKGAQLLLNRDLGWLIAGFDKDIVSIPKIGDKKHLVDLAEDNAQRFLRDLSIRTEKLNSQQRAVRVVSLLKKELSLSRTPWHIECFDNSNISGTNPVAACVVFKNGKPSKKDYRKFHVKTVEGPNDYDSMREIVYRRYERLLSEQPEKLPDLIVIDGGKGQLRAALESLERLGIADEVDIVALAERIEEVYFPGESEPRFLPRNSEVLNVLRHIRGEAHRFAITYHRKLRSKQQVKSELDEIPGIGEKTKGKLLGKYGSVKGVKEANLEDLQALVGKSKGEQLFRFLHAKERLQEIIDDRIDNR